MENIKKSITPSDGDIKAKYKKITIKESRQINKTEN